MISLVHKGIAENDHLPKVIVIVPDSDIIKQLDVGHSTVEQSYIRLLRFLFREIDRMIAAYKEKLPKRSKREFFPQVIWIIPPMHKYFSDKGL